MPHEAIVFAHHVSALSLLAFIALGVASPLLIKDDAMRRNLYPVEGMGGFAAATFQVVSGATLAGQADIPWNTPWVAGAVGCLILGLVLWMPSLTRRAKGNTADKGGIGFNAAALVCLAGSYAIMLLKPGGV